MENEPSVVERSQVGVVHLYRQATGELSRPSTQDEGLWDRWVPAWDTGWVLCDLSSSYVFQLPPTFLICCVIQVRFPSLREKEAGEASGHSTPRHSGTIAEQALLSRVLTPTLMCDCHCQLRLIPHG